MQFVKQDCWIGLYWKTVKSEPTCHCGDLLKNHGYYTADVKTYTKGLKNIKEKMKNKYWRDAH